MSVFSAFCTQRHPVFDEPLNASHPTSTLTNNDREEIARKAWPLLTSYNQEYLYPNITEEPGWKISVARFLCSLFTVSDLVWEGTGRTDAAPWLKLLHLLLHVLNINRNMQAVISELPWSSMKPSYMAKYRIQMPKAILVFFMFSGCTLKIQQIKLFLLGLIMWFHFKTFVQRFSHVGKASRGT